MARIHRVTFHPNSIRTRDHLLKALICGATKASIYVDRRKEASRRACRRRVHHTLESRNCADGDTTD